MTAVVEMRSPAGIRPRLLAGLSAEGPTDLVGHELTFGPLPQDMRPRRLIDIVERSGLVGRGGAGFPAGRKLRSVADGRRSAVVVANGSEGEPASAKDRFLLTWTPHLVMDGITVAAHAVGATEAYLVLHHSATRLGGALQAAAEARNVAEIDPVPIQVIGIPDRYTSSEQSAIVQYLSGGPARPTFAPPRPHERGVDGRPTLVNNVETLAHLALIARFGDRWLREVGTPSAPGSMLVTVSGAIARPGVYEIAAGTPVGQLLMMAGGPTERPRAILVGGYFGAWLPAEVAWPVPMTHAALRAVGGALGAGIVIVLPESSCGLAETARVVRYLSEEPAGRGGRCFSPRPPRAAAIPVPPSPGGGGRA